MKKLAKRSLHRAGSLTSAAVLMTATTWGQPTWAADYNFYGDLSAAFSWNMGNPTETPENDRYKLSMRRATARLNLDANINENASFAGKVRLVRDLSTSYLNSLERLGADAAGRRDLQWVYSENTLRELYTDLKFGDRYQLRLGKQQVVWGESDFFQAMDVVHGYDFTWRSFLEPANEDLRKPLVMANFMIQVPEADGKLQMIVRPGTWNRRDSIGNTFDVIGGRWANQPNKGLDFRTITPYNYRHPEGDAKDTTWGARWSGIAKEISYSISYLKSFQPGPPIISPAGNLALFGLPGVPSGSQPFKGRTPTGVAGEIIYPKIDLFGLTLSGYSAAADAVFSAEVAYIRDAAYNFGYAKPETPLTTALGPGFDGVKQKNLVRSMLRMDKNLALTQRLLGSEKPAFFSVQLFDTWIQNFNASEELVQLVGFGQASKEHSTLLTAILDLSYKNGTINPNLVAGWDASYGGGFLVPSVTIQFGKDWRLKLEYDHFWNAGSRTPANAATERNTALFGYFANNDQFYLKLTYQF